MLSEMLPNNVELCQQIIENSPSTIIITSGPETDHQIIYVNETFERETGYTRQEVIGKNPRFLQGEDTEQPAISHIRAALAGGKPCTVVLRNYRKDGKMFWNELRLAPIHNTKGQVTHFVGIQQDVSEREARLRPLATASANLRALLNSAKQSFIFIDREARVVEFDKGSITNSLDIFGEHLYRGANIYDFFPEDERDGFTENYQRALSGETVEIEFTLNGENYTYYFDITFFPVVDNADNIIGICISAEDITKRRLTGIALQESEERYRLITEYSHDMIALHKPDGSVTSYASPSFSQKLGFTSEELLNISPVNIVHPEDITRIAQAHRKVVKEHLTVEIDYRLRKKDGDYIWVSGFTKPILDTNSNVKHLLSVARDITERKQMEVALRKSEERYRLIASNVTDMISTHDPDGVYTFVSPSCETLLGYKPEDLLGRSAYDFFHPHDLQAIQASHENIIETQPSHAVVEYRIRRKTGDYIWFETISQIVLDETTGAPQFINAISRDITRRKQAEDALRESEERFRQLVENIKTAFWLFDTQSKTFLYMSPAYDTIWQRSHLELIQDPESFATTIHPEDHNWLIELIREPSVNSLLDVYDHRIIRPSGEVRHIRMKSFPMINEAGDIYRIAGVSEDITDELLLQEQEKALQLEIDRSQLLSTFITKTSHEFRTPLSVISTAAYVLERLDDSSKRQVKSTLITKQIKRINTLIGIMQLMVKLDIMQDINYDTVDVRTIVEHITKILDASIREKNLSVNFTQHNDITHVTADTELLTSLLYQLLKNAIHHSNNDSHIHVSVENRGEMIEIVVTDTGEGIAKQHLSNIFDRFYRVDVAHSSEGMGLGLSIAKRIAELHRGRIHVESELEMGTSFTVYLPIFKVKDI